MSSRITTNYSAQIDASAPDVYAALADYAGARQEFLPTQHITALTVVEGGYGAGTTFEATLRIPGKSLTFRHVVSEPDPGRILVEVCATGRYRLTFKVDPAGMNRARVTIALDAQRAKGWIGFAQARVIPPVVGRIFRKEVENLRRYLDYPASYRKQHLRPVEAHIDPATLTDYMAWSDGGKMSLEFYAQFHLKADLLIAYSTLFWPTFMEHKSGIFNAESFKEDAFDEWMDHFDGDVMAVEQTYNHVHVDQGLFQHMQEELSDENLHYIAHLLAKMWGAALRDQFPDKTFEVAATLQNDGDFILTFWQPRGEAK